MFRAFLRKQGIFKIPLAPFIGNRFNIFFYDAAGVYFLRQYMATFISFVHGGKANKLLTAVREDLTKTIHIAGCQALGLIDKVCTGPLWRKLQESSTSIMKIGDFYCQMKEKFDLWSENASCVLEGSAMLSDDIVMHHDDVWDCLITSTSDDEWTLKILQLIFKAFSMTTQRLLIDHLPGGIHNTLSTDAGMASELASVPVTNLSPERDFAVLDRFLREKPNAHLTR